MQRKIADPVRMNPFRIQANNAYKLVAANAMNTLKLVISTSTTKPNIRRKARRRKRGK